MKRTLSILSIIMALLICQMLLTSCRFDETPKPATTDEREIADTNEAGEHEDSNNSEMVEISSMSPCSATMDMVDQPVSVYGQVAFIAHDNPEGVFAELEANGCKIGVFAPTEIWNQWDKQQQEMLYEGAQLSISGRLVSFDGKLIVDMHNPPQVYLSDENEQEVTESEGDTAQDSIPETSLDLPPAPDDARLEVPIIYSGHNDIPGLCYLGAAAMLVKYDHPEIDFADVIALSGVGSSALHLDFPEMSMLSTRLADQSIVYMANNMQASYVLGYKSGGTGSDPFYPANLPFEDYAAHLVNFNNGEDALDFLTRAVGSGHPVMVFLNMYYVHDDFSRTSEYWKIFLGKDKAPHYMVVTGFQNNLIVLNDPTDPTEAATSLTVNTENFIQAWEETLDFPDAPPLGPYWMFFFSEPGNIPKDTTVINLNLENAIGAPLEIRNFADSIDDSENALFLLLELANARLKFADYLERNGWLDAAENFRLSGNLFIEIVTDRKVDPTILNEIATLEEEALASLAENNQ